MAQLKIGEVIPGLPDKYYALREHMEPGHMILLGTAQIPFGLGLIIKNGVLKAAVSLSKDLRVAEEVSPEVAQHIKDADAMLIGKQEDYDLMQANFKQLFN